MDSVIADPPESYLTDSYTFCEWAERVLAEVEAVDAPKVAMRSESLTTLMMRLRAHVATRTSGLAVALRLQLDEMDEAIREADRYDSAIVVPSTPFINLAHRVMEYACH